MAPDPDPDPDPVDEDRPERSPDHRAALEDMREREGRLQARNADWLYRFHARFGGPVQ